MRAALRIVLGFLTFIALGIAALMVLGGVVVLIAGFIDAPRLEHARVCRTGEHRNCIVGHQGRVLSVKDGAGLLHLGPDVRVEYDDGRGTATLHLHGHTHPPVRAFVRVEFWGARTVAITDSHGRRFKDEEWPVRWNPFALSFVAIGSAVIALPVAVIQLRLRRRR